MGPEPGFQVELRRDESGFVVTPSGELDIATVGDVRRALEGVLPFADGSPGA